MRSANASSSRRRPEVKPALMSHLRSPTKYQNPIDAFNKSRELMSNDLDADSSLVISSDTKSTSEQDTPIATQKRRPGLVEPTATLARIPGPGDRAEPRFQPNRAEVNAENLAQLIDEEVENRMKVVTAKLEGMFYSAQRQWQAKALEMTNSNNERLLELEMKVMKIGSMRQHEHGADLSSPQGEKLSEQNHNIKENASRDEDDFQAD